MITGQFTFEKKKGLYHNKVLASLSLSSVQRPDFRIQISLENAFKFLYSKFARNEFQFSGSFSKIIETSSKQQYVRK